MKIIEELIEPYSLNEFTELYFCKTPFAAPFKASRFRSLLSWPLLESILSTGHGDCWLPQQGRLPEEKELSSGTLSLAQALLGFEAGRTILVRHAELVAPLLSDIAEDFRSSFQCPVDIQLYCTPAGGEGFDWHYDLEEVFVIQSVGEKEFRLKPNTLALRPLPNPLPKNLHFEWERSPIEFRCLLKPGDWLYIPSGYWHKARALTPSYHFSVGVMVDPSNFVQTQVTSCLL